MKKILIFSLNYYPKYVGGAEVAIKEIVERQALHHSELGDNVPKYQFHMVTLRFDSNLPKYEIVHGIHVHRIGFSKPDASISDLKNTYLKYNKYIFQLYAGIYAMFLHRKYKYNAIWAMMAHSCAVPAGMFKFFNKKVKYILTLQEGDPLPHIEKLAKPIWPLFKYGFTSADITQSISTFLNDWSVRMGNKNYKAVIPNAVDFKQFTRKMSTHEISEVKNKLGKKGGEKWLITTSRLVHKNAIDDVLNAVAIYNNKNSSKIHFAILGIGPEEAKLKELVHKLNMQEYIHFVGEVKHPLLAVYLKACDIFIRPSRSEGMGNSFVEAMSMKLPVIATTEGGLSDFIFDNKTAWKVKKDNPLDIVKAIEDIINDGDKVKRITDYSYEMVKSRYDWDIIGSEMDEKVFAKI